MVKYRILEKSPFVRHTILKNDLPDYFIAFLCDNFFGKFDIFEKKNLEMDFFSKKNSNFYKPWSQSSHGLENDPPDQFYCSFM